jgi:ribosomal protein L32E
MGSKQLHAPYPTITMIDCVAHKPEPLPIKPKRKRKKTDWAQLVLPRTGRLTPTYWVLKEGFHQDVFRKRASGTGKNVYMDWRHNTMVGALIEKGYMREAKGVRGGTVFRTTEDGAFAMLIAEGIHEAKKRALTKDPPC